MIWLKLKDGTLLNYEMIHKIEGNCIFINNTIRKLDSDEMFLLEKLIEKYDSVYDVDSFKESNKKFMKFLGNENL